MRYVLRFGLALALSLALMAGCSDENGEGGNGGIAGTGGDGGQGGGGVGGDGGSGGTATLSIFVFESPAEGGILPLEDLQLCETDTANCVLTDADGTAELDLPADREISYTWQKEGYVQILRADILPADGSYVPSNVSTDARMTARFELLMSPYPMEGTGTIYAQAFSDELGIVPIADATFELVGATGKAFYLDDDGEWTLNLAATTSQGSGGFVEVSPGEHELKVGGAVERCEVLRGWPSDSENAMRVPVRAGHMTITRFYCPPE